MILKLKVITRVINNKEAKEHSFLVKIFASVEALELYCLKEQIRSIMHGINWTTGAGFAPSVIGYKPNEIPLLYPNIQWQILVLYYHRIPSV